VTSALIGHPHEAVADAGHTSRVGHGGSFGAWGNARIHKKGDCQHKLARICLMDVCASQGTFHR
jgi:hypothetical protein